MGEFTWHTSDPDHGLLVIEPGTGLPCGLSEPVYLLAPDGRKWREDDYEGYGVFGGVESGAELARWNFPKEKTEGKSENELHRSAGELFLYPYGGGDYGMGAPKFPLKFTRNPEATYEELPASIPASSEAKYLSLADFDVVLADGTVLSGEGWVNTSDPIDYSDPESIRNHKPSGYLDGLGKFWVARVRELGLAEDIEEDGDYSFDVASDVFYDSPEELTLPEGASMLYTGWRSSLHETLRAPILDNLFDNLRPIRNCARLMVCFDRERLTVLADAFDGGFAQGAADYDRMAGAQVELFENNLPMNPERLYPDAPYFMDNLSVFEDGGKTLTDTYAEMLGRMSGASFRSGQLSGMDSKPAAYNPFRHALRARDIADARKTSED